MKTNVKMSVVSDYFNGNMYALNRFFQYPNFIGSYTLNPEKIKNRIKEIKKTGIVLETKTIKEIEAMGYYEAEYYYHCLIADLVVQNISMEIDLTGWFEKKKLSSLEKIQLAVMQYRKDETVNVVFPEKQLKTITRRIKEDEKAEKNKKKMNSDLKRIWH